jgi:hypothetical protein
MMHSQSFNCSAVQTEKTAVLPSGIGQLLIACLDGLDVINFIEAVNGSEHFQTLDINEEWFFYKIFMKFNRTVVPYLHLYLDTCSIDEEGYLRPEKYHQGEPPTLRMFIHPTFTNEAFKQLCRACMTSSFQCYTRLLPFNTHSDVGNLMLIDYFQYKDSFGCNRELNAHEQSLFKGLIL